MASGAGAAPDHDDLAGMGFDFFDDDGESS